MKSTKRLLAMLLTLILCLGEISATGITVHAAPVGVGTKFYIGETLPETDAYFYVIGSYSNDPSNQFGGSTTIKGGIILEKPFLYKKNGLVVASKFERVTDGVSIDTGLSDYTSYDIMFIQNYEECVKTIGMKVSGGNGSEENPYTLEPIHAGSGETYVAVILDDNLDGKLTDRFFVKTGEKATAPEPLSVEGKVFTGWFTDKACTEKFNFETVLTDNITLYAGWTEVHEYNLWVGGTQVTSANMTSIPCDSGKVSYNPETKTLTLDNAVLTKADSGTFIIESKDDLTIEGTGMLVNPEAKAAIFVNKSGASLKLDADLDIKAAYSGVFSLSGKIEFAGGDISIETTADEDFGITASKLVFSGGNVEVVSKIVGIYALEGIYISGGTIDAVGDVVAVATVTGKTIAIGSKLEMTSPAGGTIGNVVIKDATYNAILDDEGNAATSVKIEPKKVEYTITFNANKKTATDMPAAQTVTEGNKATNPDKAPKAEGFVFDGWYTSADCKDSEKYDFDSAVTGNVTLYAKWTTEKVNVTGVTLSDTTLSLEEGADKTLTVTVAPAEASDKTVIWTSGDAEIATVDESGKVTAVKAGTVMITVTATNGTEETGDDKTASCEVTVTDPASEESGNTLEKQEDGSLRYLKDGNWQSAYNGLVSIEGIWYYIENGVWIQDKYAFIEYEGYLFLVANGVLAQVNGLQMDPNGDNWYFCAEGQVVKHTGLVEYDNEWFYVENGVLDTGLNALVEYDGGLFYVAAGRIVRDKSGLAQDPKTSDWYFLALGEVQVQYTGLAFYDDEWFYVEKGKLAVDYTGPVEYDGETFNVVSGMVK